MTRGDIAFLASGLVALLGCGVVIWVHWDDPVPEPECSEFRNVVRGAVPARCFSDFLGKDGGQ